MSSSKFALDPSPHTCPAAGLCRQPKKYATGDTGWPRRSWVRVTRVVLLKADYACKLLCLLSFCACNKARSHRKSASRYRVITGLHQKDLSFFLTSPICTEKKRAQDNQVHFARSNIFSSLIDPPPEEPCDINCTWDALKARAKDLVRGLLRTEVRFEASVHKVHQVIPAGSKST